MKPAPKRRFSFTGLLEVSVLLLCVATVAGFLGSRGWLLDLAAHFRAQYFVLLLVSAVAAWIVRQRALALVAGVFSLPNLILLLPLWLGGQGPTPVSAQPLRVMLFNVHTDNPHKDRVLESIRASRADIVVVLEADAEWLGALAPLRGEWPFEVSEPRGDNFGIVLWSRFPLRESEVVYWGEAEVPSIVCEIDVPGRAVRFVATHPLPPTSRDQSRMRDEQLDLLAKHVATLDGPVVVAGDLNTTPWGASFRRLLRDARLKDSAAGQGWQSTWPAFLPPMGIPIDHLLVSPDIHVVRRSTGPAAGSDHRPVLTDLLLPPPSR